MVSKELHALNNFHSLSAILKGLSDARVQIDPAFAAFADPSMNYRLYRTHLHTEPSLPFLYPLVIDLRRGNRRALLSIFGFLLYDVRRLE